MTSSSSSDAFAQEMDTVLKDAVETLPGVVVLAKCGDHTYHKAFGFADREQQVMLDKDAIFRMYSMTKVMTSTLALILQDKVNEPSTDDPVSKYIPSFAREWHVVEEDEDSQEAVDVFSMIAGTTERIHYRRRKSTSAMLVKHLMAESSGIGYEKYSDMERHGTMGKIGTKRGFSIANALRMQICPTVYKSSCILGHDCNLEEFCEVIAKAGALCADPGNLSYGLGAAVLGRIIEVVYAKHFEAKPLRDIFQELLFKPLGMTSAVFYDKDLIHRLPRLYGIQPAGDGQCSIVPAELSVPSCQPAYSNHTDHYSGAMKFDSGDTGSAMTVGDYSKFLECLLRGGAASDGSQVMSSRVVETLVNGQHTGVSYANGLAQKMGFSDDGPVFTFGWAKKEESEGSPKQNYWSGYAGTHVRLYPEHNSYFIQGIQCMDHAGTGFLNGKVRQPCLDVFLKHLQDQPNAKRQRYD